jgi:multidrug transporter EmrE-like cation transporter
LLSAAALPFLPFPAAHSWPWLAASVLLQVTYYGLVARCYQQVDMSLAYPLMRGSAPILVALAGTLLGEPLPAAAWLGVVLVSTGILCMALGARGGQLRLPLLTAAMIATYTLVDAQVRASPAARSATRCGCSCCRASRCRCGRCTRAAARYWTMRGSIGRWDWPVASAPPPRMRWRCGP